MSPAPHAPCGGQHCPVVAMLLAPRSNPLPSHCHIPFPCPLPVSAHRAPMSPPLPRSPGHGRRPEAGVPQDGVRSGEHRLGHTDAALDAPRVVDVLRARRRALHGQHSRANARETEQMSGDSPSGGAHFSMCTFDRAGCKDAMAACWRPGELPSGGAAVEVLSTTTVFQTGTASLQTAAGVLL